MRVPMLLSILVISLSGTPVLAGLEMFASPTETEIAQRIEEVNPPDKGLPEDLIGMNDERLSLVQEMANIKAFVRNADDLSQEIAALSKVKNEVALTFNQLSTMDCKRISDQQTLVIERLRQPVNSNLSRRLRDFPLGSIENPWENSPVVRSSDEEQCTSWKAFLSASGKKDSLLSYFDVVKEKLSAIAEEDRKAKGLAKTLLGLLQKRKELLEERYAKRDTQDTLTDKLWIALGVIGVFSIGTIGAIRMFDTKIQVEWVASGQVIQFVTVMILLSVVMALGLAGILKENTLGTLLGGIAGYVLAQGVGRAAAREVSRDKSG